MRTVRTAAVVGLLAVAVAQAGVCAGPPLTPEQAQALDGARQYALAYTNRLPDFICTQTTTRTRSTPLTASAIVGRGGGTGWIPPWGPGAGSDKIVERLAFLNHSENYEVVSINDHTVKGMDHLALGGATSTGEFGTALGEIFEADSRAEFSWHTTTSLRGHRVEVFDFAIPKDGGIMVRGSGPGEVAQVPYGGQVFVDESSHEVVRIAYTLDLPPGFSINFASRSVDYDPVTIAGKRYTLPSRSDVRMESNGSTYVNKIEFREYRKFETESTIHYEGEPPPEAK